MSGFASRRLPVRSGRRGCSQWCLDAAGGLREPRGPGPGRGRWDRAAPGTGAVATRRPDGETGRHDPPFPGRSSQLGVRRLLEKAPRRCVGSGVAPLAETGRHGASVPVFPRAGPAPLPARRRPASSHVAIWGGKAAAVRTFQYVSFKETGAAARGRTPLALGGGALSVQTFVRAAAASAILRLHPSLSLQATSNTCCCTYVLFPAVRSTLTRGTERSSSNRARPVGTAICAALALRTFRVP